MNWKMFAASNWKMILLLIQLGMLAITISIGKAAAEPIDNPWGP